MRGRRLTRAEAIDVHCPTCLAAPGDPCVYIPNTNLLRPNITSPNIIAARERIGTPARIPHNDRMRSPYDRLRAWLAEYGDILYKEHE